MLLGLNPCFGGKKFLKSKVFCSALSLSLTVEMSTGHFFILVVLGFVIVHDLQIPLRIRVLILVVLGFIIVNERSGL